MMKKRLTAALLAAGLLLAGCAADRGTAPPSGSESGGEFEVTVVMLLSGDFDDGLHILGFEHCVFRGFELVEFFVQLRERTVAVGLHEGGGQMTHHGGVTAALGNLRLSDVVDDVQIIMWNPARKHVRPVVT